MIRIEDLQEAIAECEGQRNPNANTCIKLAAYQIIMDHLQEKTDVVIPTYSTKAAETIQYEGESEFSKAIEGMGVDDLLPVIDELMETLQIVNPRIYDGVMRRIWGRV